jgi:hypothetical protein
VEVKTMLRLEVKNLNCQGMRTLKCEFRSPPMHTYRFGKKIKLPSTIAIKHQIRKLMWEDLVKETEVIARAEAIRRSLSEETLHEQGTKVVSASSTDHQSLISPPTASAPNTLAAKTFGY